MIELTKANPDVETLKLTLWAAGGIIALLLAVVAYFLKRQIAVSEILTRAVNNLTTAVTVLESQQKDRHPVIERRLNAHAKRLDEHDVRIARVETTCSLNHKKK
jgi:beta-lactamase regulating signal transducer with metallopeptidase domain